LVWREGMPRRDSHDAADHNAIGEPIIIALAPFVGGTTCPGPWPGGDEPELKKWAAKNASQSRAAFHHGPEAEISFRARTKTGSACVGRSPRSSGWVPFGLGPAGQGRPRGPQKRILTAVKRCPQRLFLEGRTKERPPPKRDRGHHATGSFVVIF